MCILTKAVSLFLGHFLRYESTKVPCSHGPQVENAQKLKFPITSCLDRKWHKTQSFEGIFQDMEALGYSIVDF